MLGITMFVLAAAASVFFMVRETPQLLRAIVFFPFFIGMLGFFQAKERTCIIFAYRNTRDLGAGEERVEDPAASRFLKVKSQKIMMQSFFLSLVLTAVCMMIR